MIIAQTTGVPPVMLVERVLNMSTSVLGKVTAHDGQLFLYHW